MGVPFVSSRARDYVRDRAEAFMDATCRVERMTPGEYDEESLIYSPGTRTTIYEGVCRIWEVTNTTAVQVGENEMTMQTTNLSLPWDIDPVPRKDDEALILTANDTAVVGKRFQIQDHSKSGALRPTRRFSVTMLQEQK